MTEAEILAMTYHDKCTVYRPFKYISEETGETAFLEGLNGQIVYDEIPCALSTPSGSKPNRSSGVIITNTDYKLFYAPDIDIQAGDTLLIEHLDRHYVVLAGKPDLYESHNQLNIKEDTIA